MPTLEDQIEACTRTIERLHSQMLPLQQDLVAYNRSLATLRSQKWIQDNGVTRENTQDPPTDVYHQTITEFRDWLVKTGNTKPFVSWNGIIMFRNGLDSGRWMWNDLHGRVEDLTT